MSAHPSAESNLSQAAVSVKISNLLICFCSCELSCPLLENGNSIEDLYVVMCCRIKQRSF